MKLLTVASFSLFFAINTFASENSPIEINLGATVMRQVSLEFATATTGDFDISVDTSNLTPLDPNHEVSILASTSRIHIESATQAQIEVMVQTAESAPSFSSNFTVRMKDSAHETMANISLAVKPVYVVDVRDGATAGTFEFSSSEKLVYLRPHAAGLVIEFRNLSSQSVVIHGNGAVPHQDPSKPLLPGNSGKPNENGVYSVPAIFPAKGLDIQGSYTLHGVYKPERKIVVNATIQ